MLYTKKNARLFIKAVLFFMAVLFSVQLYASDTAIYLDQTSIDSISCTETDCFFPKKSPSEEDIRIVDQINWSKNENLVLRAKGNIVFEKNGKITCTGKTILSLQAGIEPGKKDQYSSTVVFEGDSAQIEMFGDGKTNIYYNPQKGDRKYKYHNPTSYIDKIISENKVTSYMLINDIDDLQDISKFLSGNYALSQNIDASETQYWAAGKGFMPMGGKRQAGKPFSGNFDGNNYVIDQLYINRPEEDEVAIFSLTSGRMLANNMISDLHIKHANITGNFHVGVVVGEGINTDLLNINIENSIISGYGIEEHAVKNNLSLSSVGYIIGAAQYGFLCNLNKDETTQVYVNGKLITDNMPHGAYFMPTTCEEKKK